MNDKIYIIVPVYNEEKSIKKVINDLRKYFRNIIIINDGSTDNTINEIGKFDTHIINNIKNLGQGASIRIGVEYALKENAEYFATFDSDGQHNSDDLYNMLNYLIDNNLDIVIGSRFMNSDLKISFLRKIILKSAIQIEYLFYGIKKEDIFIDCLSLTVSAQQEEALETLKCIKMVKEKICNMSIFNASN